MSLGTLEDLNVCGTLMTLCRTRLGVKVGARVAIVVVHGLVPHGAKKQVMTLK